MSQSNEELEDVVMSGINADYRAGDEPLTRAERALTELMARLRRAERIEKAACRLLPFLPSDNFGAARFSEMANVSADLRAALSEKESGR